MSPHCSNQVSLYHLSAHDIKKRLDAKDLTVESYMQALLSRVEDRDRIVKAWVSVDCGKVLDQARELDRLPMSERGPLHGIPVGVKDVINTRDYHTRHNSPICERNTATTDAACVSTLRSLGAVIFGEIFPLALLNHRMRLIPFAPGQGKTTTTEFAATGDGPETTNPHSPLRTPGGSSSGSAAAVADFHIPLALGTQTGGSLMRPASYTGVLAFKPTWGLVSTEGCKSFSPIFDTIGFFARSIEDLVLVADGFRIRDQFSGTADESDNRGGLSRISLKQSRFAVVKTSQWAHAETGTVKALEKMGELLRAEGARVEELDLPSDFDDVHEMHKSIMHTDGASSFFAEYLRASVDLSPTIRGYVENTGKFTIKGKISAMDTIARLRPIMDGILGQYTAIIAPSALGEAPIGKKTGLPLFNTIWTALHLPTIHIPGFHGPEGLPVGISLVAARYNDRYLLRVAKVVEAVIQSRACKTKEHQ